MISCWGFTTSLYQWEHYQQQWYILVFTKGIHQDTIRYHWWCHCEGYTKLLPDDWLTSTLLFREEWRRAEQAKVKCCVVPVLGLQYLPYQYWPTTGEPIHSLLIPGRRDLPRSLVPTHLIREREQASWKVAVGPSGLLKWRGPYYSLLLCLNSPLWQHPSLGHRNMCAGPNISGTVHINHKHVCLNTVLLDWQYGSLWQYLGAEENLLDSEAGRVCVWSNLLSAKLSFPGLQCALST